MDRLVFGGIAVALLGLGLCMVIWPGWITLNSRDDGDDRPLTIGELWAIRVVGVGMVFGCAYGLYAMLTGMPGAEFGAP
jgi:hypothetical protein